MLRFSPALTSALASAVNKTEWCNTLITALGATRQLVIKRADSPDDVWGTGTTILDAPVTGTMSATDGVVTGLGVIGDPTTQIAGSLSSGAAVMRIIGQDPTNWVEGTMGLVGSGQDFVTRASPANANTGFGFLVSAGIAAPGNLPLTGGGGGGDLVLITTTEAVSSSGSAQSNVPFTFGQPFKQGDWNPTTHSLYAKVDGADVPIQADAVSTFADGTARLAVLTTRLPSLPGNGSKAVEIYRGPTYSQPAGTFDTSTWDPIVVATIGGVEWTASPRAALLAQLVSKTGIRLNGEVAKELRVTVPFKNPSNVDHAHLRARFDVRLYNNGTIRTDLIVENNWLLVASPAPLTYSVNCTQGVGGSTIFTQASFTHHYRTRWHRVFWHGTQAQVRPRHNKAYFLDSKITWNYNRDLVVSGTALTNMQNAVNSSNTGPMGTGTLTTDMPGTGGRDEIAPVPRWTAMWLISQDVRAWTAMLGNADACASAPIHYRDENTDLPVSVVARPNIATRYGTSSPSIPSVSYSGPWNPDIAHQGSYTFIPYVLTGDHFYIEETAFWASWDIAANDPAGRGGASGHLPPVEQLRGAAWGFRAILEAAYGLPDSHPLKSYFNTIKNNNITFFNNNYTTTSDNTYVFPLGGMKGIYNNNQIPGYENDFMMYVMAWAIENGESGLVAAFNNVGRYVVGRFTAAVQAQGFCTAQASHYWFNSRSGSTPYTTWSAYASANGAGGTCGTVAPTTDPAYSNWAEGYAAVSRGMLGAAANAGHADAPAAYTRWLTFTPNLAADYVNSPQYDIVPR